MRLGFSFCLKKSLHCNNIIIIRQNPENMIQSISIVKFKKDASYNSYFKIWQITCFTWES